jgi:thioredoxin-related protein
MKTILSITFLLVGFFFSIHSQSSKVNLYNPALDAKLQIDSALKIASKENKHVLIQVGGNWCPWCIRLNKFYTEDLQLDSALKANYVLVHLNYSKENKNLKTLERLEYPQRFGFPVLVILNGNGQRLHTQNSVYLEEGKGYNKEKVLDFFNAWSPAAIDPKKYSE